MAGWPREFSEFWAKCGREMGERTKISKLISTSIRVDWGFRGGDCREEERRHQSGVVFLVAAVTVPFVLGAQKWKHMQGKRNPAFGLLLK